jgi:NAD(P)-dependent dehydrogenase (short-subunit alcohol dehydrogenase family)
MAVFIGFRFHPNSYSFPITNFGRKGFDFDLIPNLRHKVIIVTGATAGLGLSSSKYLAQKGATVIMGCRNVEKGEKAKRQLIEEFGIDPSLLRVMPLELSSLASVEQFVQEFKSCKYKKLIY